MKPTYDELTQVLADLVAIADKSIPADGGLSNSELMEAETAINKAQDVLRRADDPFAAFPGKTVKTIEACDREFLITFTDNSEIAVTLENSGGDYGSPYLSIVPTEGS